MNQKLSHPFIFLASLFLIIACNDAGEKETTTTTTDTITDTSTEVLPTAPQGAMDAVAVAPNLYRVLADSLGLRVLEASYKPGDSSAMHSHPDHAVYVVQGGSSTFTDQNGETMKRELKTGWSRIWPAASHRVHNTGSTATKVIVVEINRANQYAPWDTALDGTKVSANLYKVKNDSMNIRIVEINQRPGQASAMHAHNDAALYVISGSKAEFTDKSGNKQTAELRSGMAMIRPAETHSVKNIGSTPVRAVLIEVNRQRQ